jgi:curved DNA-binding protein CbpA
MLDTFALPPVSEAPDDLHQWTPVAVRKSEFAVVAASSSDEKSASCLKVYRRTLKRITDFQQIAKSTVLPFGQQYHRYHSCHVKSIDQPTSYFGNYTAFVELIRQRRLEAESKKDEEYSQQKSGDKFEDLYEDKESSSMLRLDPTKWKEQDHYKVLGLGRMRWKATDEDIKRAYRKKVLKHHPDKKQDRASGDDNYFKCVQKGIPIIFLDIFLRSIIAYEFMSDPNNRRQYDSIDPAFDTLIPRELDSEDFFATFGPMYVFVITIFLLNGEITALRATLTFQKSIRFHRWAPSPLLENKLKHSTNFGLPLNPGVRLSCLMKSRSGRRRIGRKGVTWNARIKRKECVERRKRRQRLSVWSTLQSNTILDWPDSVRKRNWPENIKDNNVNN